MIVEQLYTNCLSEAAYFIASNKEAAIIDPLRDIHQYLKLAEKHQVSIKYIFETHFHADFVSGHLELAKKTGATIVYGPETVAAFTFHKAKDGEEFDIGGLKLKVIHTPGHTVESSSYLLYDKEGEPYCIFTGDTLFVGDVGRPDLFSGKLSKEELASMMYDSLNNKIKPLPDHVIVYPAHGPGSACGKNLGKETFSTIATQKATNYALKDQTRQEFIAQVTQGLAVPPPYFSFNARMNAQNYDSLDLVLKNSLRPLSLEEFEHEVSKDSWILDTRNAEIFTEEFIPGSINIGLEGRYAEWAGNLLPIDQPLVLVTEPGKEEESIIRLARIGLDKVMGYLEGGFHTWKDAGKPIDLIINVSPEELAMDIPFDNKLMIVDVRKTSEYDNAHVQGAQNLPLEKLIDPLYMAQIDDSNNLYIHCAGGYRSVIASSLIKRQGFHNLRNVTGGFGKMKETQDIPIIEPSKHNA